MSVLLYSILKSSSKDYARARVLTCGTPIKRAWRIFSPMKYELILISILFTRKHVVNEDDSLTLLLASSPFYWNEYLGINFSRGQNDFPLG